MGLQAGAYVLQVALLSLKGYPMGQLITPDAPVNGTVYAPYVVPSLVEYRPETLTEQEATSYARMKQRGKLPLGVSAFSPAQLTLSEHDPILDAMVQGYTKDTASATGAVITASNNAYNKVRRVLLGLTSADVAVDSALNYSTVWKWGTLRRSVGHGINSGNGQNTNNKAFTFRPFLSLRTPLGQLFSASVVNPDNGQDDEYMTTDTGPHSLATWVDDGAATTILLPYAPDYTEHAGVHNLLYKQGVDNKANVSGISGATLTVTHGTAADIWVTLTPSTAILSLAS